MKGTSFPGLDGLVPADSPSGGGCSLSGAAIPVVSWRTGVVHVPRTVLVGGCKVHNPSTQVTSGTIQLRRRMWRTKKKKTTKKSRWSVQAPGSAVELSTFQHN